METQLSEVPAEDVNEISAPLVFSCSKCRVTVGDTFSFMKSNAEMNTMTLTAASNIQRSADVYTSKAGPDVGSTYFRFTCAECQNALGRYYLTTSADLDCLREKFTFTVESITSYELGKSQHGKIQDLIPDQPAISTVEVSHDPSGGESNPELTLDSLNQEMLKTQAVIIDLLDRFARQERSIHMLLTSQHPNNHNTNHDVNWNEDQNRDNGNNGNTGNNGNLENRNNQDSKRSKSQESGRNSRTENHEFQESNKSNHNPNNQGQNRQKYSSFEPSRSVDRSTAEKNRSVDRNTAERGHSRDRFSAEKSSRSGDRSDRSDGRSVDRNEGRKEGRSVNRNTAERSNRSVDRNAAEKPRSVDQFNKEKSPASVRKNNITTNNILEDSVRKRSKK